MIRRLIVALRPKLAKLTLALCLVSIVAALIPPQTAHAYVNCGSGPYIEYGRYEFCGYFGNQYDSIGTRLWNGGVPNSVNSASSFITWVENNRNSANSADRTSAEFVIDTMEGLYPPNNTRGAAWTMENDWETRINKGLADGRLAVQWFWAMPWYCGQHNTFYQVAENDVAFYITSAASSETPACGPGVTTPAIRFYNPSTGQTYFRIKRNCGNPVGPLSALPKVDYTIVPSGFANRYIVTQGDTDTIHVSLHNNGPSSSDPGAVQVHAVLGGTGTGAGAGSVTGASAIPGSIAQPCGPTCVGPGQTALSGGYSSSYGYQTAPAVGGFNGPDWFWKTKSIKSNTTTSSQFNITIANNAPMGLVTFNICTSPQNESGGSVCAHVTISIVSERTPGVIGLNGDSHAGGGLGDACMPSTGNAIGFSPGVSYDQYVVSVTGAIGGFGTNGSNANGNLKFGTNGAYAAVCRPNLLQMAEDMYAGTGYNIIGGVGVTDVDISGLSGVYFYNGADLHIHGTVNNKLTIVARSGMVTVSNNIAITPGVYAAHDAPSLGVIASGEIRIAAAATRVDAYLFSKSLIDTCLEGQNVATRSACNTPQLVVNGFLMGSDLSFRRQGVFNTNGTGVKSPISELIVLTPQIYLNPPKLFDASVDATLLESQGERQPLY